jgi:hypothetical protein
LNRNPSTKAPDKDVVEMIEEGVMICTGGYTVGRQFTGRN